MSVGNVNLDEMIAKLVARMDDCRDKIDVCDLNVNDEQLKSKLEVFCTGERNFCYSKFINLITMGPLFIVQKNDVHEFCLSCLMYCMSCINLVSVIVVNK